MLFDALERTLHGDPSNSFMNELYQGDILDYIWCVCSSLSLSLSLSLSSSVFLFLSPSLSAEVGKPPVVCVCFLFRFSANFFPPPFRNTQLRARRSFL